MGLESRVLKYTYLEIHIAWIDVPHCNRVEQFGRIISCLGIVFVFPVQSAVVPSVGLVSPDYLRLLNPHLGQRVGLQVYPLLIHQGEFTGRKTCFINQTPPIMTDNCVPAQLFFAAFRRQTLFFGRGCMRV